MKIIQFSCGAKSLEPATVKALIPSATATPQPRGIFEILMLNHITF